MLDGQALESTTVQNENDGARSISLAQSRTKKMIEKYLNSSIFEGVGPIIAKRIVVFFGVETPSVIETEPQRLSAVNGVGKNRIAAITVGWSRQQSIKAACTELISKEPLE